MPRISPLRTIAGIALCVILATGMLPAAAFALPETEMVCSEPTSALQSGDYVDGDAHLTITGVDVYSYAFEVLDLVNQQRAAYGLTPLTMDQDLLETAMQRAAEIAVYFSHTRPNGQSCFSASSKMRAENIAAGQTSPSAAMNSWMNSSGHRANILGSSTTIGIGVFYHNGGLYWVQCFGGANLSTATNPGDWVVVHAVEYQTSSFDPQFTIIHQGDGNQVVCRIYNGFRYSYPDPTSFTWTSSNRNVCVVSETGTLTYRGGGNAVIRAENSTLAAECLVTVDGEPINITAIEQFVKRLYTVVLGRSGNPEVDDPEGFQAQVNGVISMGAAQIAYNFFDSTEFRNANLLNDEQIQRAYRAFFERDAETDGLRFWMDYLECGMTINSVVAGFAESQEYANRCAEWGVPTGNASQIRARDTFQARDMNYGATSFIYRLYTIALNRSSAGVLADGDGLNAQTKAILNGMPAGQIGQNIFGSQEFRNRKLTYKDQIRVAYLAMLGREADENELPYWVDRMEQGEDIVSIVYGFSQSQEFSNLCAQYGVRPR